MEETGNLKGVLRSIVSLLASHHRRLDAIEDRAIALKAAIRGLDPTFDDVHAEHIDDIQQAIQPHVHERERLIA